MAAGSPILHPKPPNFYSACRVVVAVKGGVESKMEGRQPAHLERDRQASLRAYPSPSKLQNRSKPYGVSRRAVALRSVPFFFVQRRNPFEYTRIHNRIHGSVRGTANVRKMTGRRVI